VRIRWTLVVVLCAPSLVLPVSLAGPVGAARMQNSRIDSTRLQSKEHFTAAANVWAPATVAPPAVLPSGLPAQNEWLRASACSSRAFCVSVGAVSDANYDYFPLVETLSGGEWTAQVVPIPGGNQPGRWVGGLNAVSCPADGQCAAIGTFDVYNAADQINYQVPLLDNLDSGSWSSTEGAFPPGVPSTDESVVNSVSCPTTTFCMATGVLWYDSEISVTWSWSPSGWVANELTLPPTQFIDPQILSISCADNEDCVAVGWYIDTTGAWQGLIFTFSSGTWTWQEAPLPSNAATPPGSVNTSLEGVDCPEADACVAVGTYKTSSAAQPLIEELHSGTWTPSEGPVPIGAGTYQVAGLTGVSCPAIGSCIATGEYSGSAMIVSQSGESWSAIAAPLPATFASAIHRNGAGTLASTSPTLDGIGCGGSGTCVAGGSEGTSGFVETAQLPSIPSVNGVTPALGSSGTAVTISGSNLDAASQVQFGGIDASTTFVSSDQLEAIVPPGIACTSTVRVISGGVTTRAQSGDVFTRSDCSPPVSPTSVAAVADPGSAVVSFAPPSSDGGTPVTGYVVTASDLTNATRGGQSVAGTATSMLINGLTPGDTYRFIVAGVNSVGTGTASAPSNSVVTLPEAFAITTTALSPATIGRPYSEPLQAVGGAGQLKWKITSGVLPKGLKLNAAGVITGEVKSRKRAPPTGTYSLTVTVTEKSASGKLAVSALIELPLVP
jgi:hypothetical protein